MVSRDSGLICYLCLVPLGDSDMWRGVGVVGANGILREVCGTCARQLSGDPMVNDVAGCFRLLEAACNLPVFGTYGDQSFPSRRFLDLLDLACDCDPLVLAEGFGRRVWGVSRDCRV